MMKNNFSFSKTSLLLVAFYVFMLILVWGAYLELPLQHFDWLTAYVDQYLPHDNNLTKFEGLAETIKYQLHGGGWLFRPAAAIFYHINFIVNGANPEKLAAIKLCLLIITAASFVLYATRFGLEAPKIFYSLALLLFSPSQALLMSYSPESQLACFYLVGLLAIAFGVANRSCLIIFAGSSLVAISSGFKEIGIVMSYGCVATLAIVAFTNKTLQFKLRLAIIFSAIFIAILAGVEFAMLSKNIQTKNLFSIVRFSDNIKYLLPFQLDTNGGKFFMVLLAPIIASGILGIYIEFRSLIFGNKTEKYAQSFLSCAMIFSGVLGLFALSVDAAYPPRTTPRYLYPLVICLFMPVFMNSKKLRNFNIYNLIVLVAIVWHGSAVQINRTNDFKFDEQAFSDLVGVGALLRSMDPCVFTVSSSGKGFVETEDMLHHIYGTRGRQFGIIFNESPRDLNLDDLKACSEIKIVSARNFLDFIHSDLLSNLHLNSVIEMHKVRSLGKSNSFLNPIPYFESGTLPLGQVHSFRIYSFSRDRGVMNKEIKFMADGNWNEIPIPIDHADNACYFPVLSETRDLDVNVRYERDNKTNEEFFKSKDSPFYSYEPRIFCVDSAQKIEVRAKDSTNPSRTISVNLVKAFPNSLDKIRY